MTVNVSPVAGLFRSHDRLESQHKVPFPLLSDPDAHLSLACGAVRAEVDGAGANISLLGRTFIIDASRRVRRIHERVAAGAHAAWLPLNDEHEGGVPRLPEYGPHSDRPAAGCAVVLSMLHEAIGVTSGRRFVLIVKRDFARIGRARSALHRLPRRAGPVNRPASRP